jgi:hypothetical protein
MPTHPPIPQNHPSPTHPRGVRRLRPDRVARSQCLSVPRAEEAPRSAQ